MKIDRVAETELFISVYVSEIPKFESVAQGCQFFHDHGLELVIAETRPVELMNYTFKKLPNYAGVQFFECVESMRI